MNTENTSLKSLLQTNKKAQQFFGSLPDFVQGGIMLKADSVTNEAQLHKCAEEIFHEFE